MYQIDRENNSLVLLEAKSFSNLGFRERDHLQEWICKNPSVLAEELLIIQKEFNGFDDTKERLDILALDKQGNLVIVENKLDDTGRDVVWQALKYTSYCSTLSTAQIVEMFQQFLRKEGSEADPRKVIGEFVHGSREDFILNQNDQRIILVANTFRKEVTSTVMWLLNHNVRIQCFRAIPYVLEGRPPTVLLQFEQIIPLLETEEYIIKIREKVNEEQDRVRKRSDQILMDFWTGLVREVSQRKALSFVLKSDPVRPQFYYSFAKEGVTFAFCIGEKVPRSELYFNDDPDKKKIDSMKVALEEAKSDLLSKLIFQRLENRKASRIKIDMSVELNQQLNIGWNDQSTWPDYYDWYIESMDRLYRELLPVWVRVKKNL